MTEQMTWDNELMTTKLSPEYIVTQSNKLIETPTGLNLQERRIILTLASLIQPNDEDFRLHRIKVRDLADILGIQEKNFYRKVQEVVTGLQKKMLTIVSENGNPLNVQWLASSEYYLGEGVVELEFSKKLQPYLLKLQKEYTPFKLRNVLRLRSEYSMKMYELLKQYEKLHKRELSYADLRYVLDIPETKYRQYGHFKDKVLKQAQTELKEKTDLCFTYDEIKRGRKVVGFVFHIKKNQLLLKDVIDQEELQDEPYGLLVRFGIRPQTASQMTLTYSSKRITENVKYVVDTKAKEDIDNISGYIIKAIENNYADVLDEEKEVQTLEEINKIVSRYAFFADQKVKEGLISKEANKEEMLKYFTEIMTEVVRDRRQAGLDPLKDSDFEHPLAQQAYRMTLRRL